MFFEFILWILGPDRDWSLYNILALKFQQVIQTIKMIPEIGILLRFLLGFDQFLDTESSETPVLVKSCTVIIKKQVDSITFTDIYSRDALQFSCSD